MDEIKISIIQNNLIKLKSLLNNNEVDINVLLETGWTCLMYACNNARVEIISFLLNYGADPRICHDDYTCLMIIVNSYNADDDCAICLKFLINAGADVNQQDGHGNTAFVMAVNSNKLNCASALLELNADPNISRKDGSTALTIAAQKQNIEMVKLLLNIKGDLAIKSIDKENALELAKRLKFIKIANLLSSDGCQADSHLDKFILNEIESTNMKSNYICARSINNFDLFLISNDIQNLKPIFEKYSIDETCFNTLTEIDLIKMDICEPNLVNKLITIISKINHNSARNNLKINKAYKNYSIDESEITCCECVDVMKSTKDHFSFALSCVATMHNEYGKANILTTEMDVEHINSLGINLNECIENVLNLENDLNKFQSHLLNVYGDQLPRLPNLKNTEKSNFNFFRNTFALTIITASASIILFYLFKRNSV